VAGTALGFIFYVLTFMQVLKTPSLSPGRRIFWIVAIVCVPMIGNLIYLIMHDADVRKQVPKPEI
jgi:phospholipase D-like protein